MLLSSEVLNKEERAQALSFVPWRTEVRELVGGVYGALRNQAVDLIDASIGPNHARAALVAIYEGCDLLLEATIDIAESVACQNYFIRVTPMDPLGDEALTNPEDVARIPWRFARYAAEDAASRIVTAGDHLANAHIRLAWEANAATLEEVKACRFDPDVAEPKSWITVPNLQDGLERPAGGGLRGVLESFALNKDFEVFASSAPVKSVRDYRHAVLHRARPTYRELPALGRTTQWVQNTFSIKFPPSEPREDLPSIDEYRDHLARALEATLTYAHALWDLSIRWLRTVDVWVTFTDEEVRVETKHGAEVGFPREQRDPGPFLAVPNAT